GVPRARVRSPGNQRRRRPDLRDGTPAPTAPGGRGRTTHPPPAGVGGSRAAADRAGPRRRALLDELHAGAAGDPAPRAARARGAAPHLQRAPGPLPGVRGDAAALGAGLAGGAGLSAPRGAASAAAPVRPFPLARRPGPSGKWSDAPAVPGGLLMSRY